MENNKLPVMDDITMRSAKRFPGGFRTWAETFFEISANIATVLGSDDFEYMDTKTTRLYHEQGRAAMYDRAIELTDEFETKNEGREWDGEFFEEIDEFFIKKELE